MLSQFDHLIHASPECLWNEETCELLVHEVVFDRCTACSDPRELNLHFGTLKAETSFPTCFPNSVDTLKPLQAEDDK
jgi:hypothetical protein